ncbi:MAG: hypothetical protein IKM32_04995 [Clostridia bacterium]|nr:hypothetical protein [Clostridia bacterium]
MVVLYWLLQLGWGALQTSLGLILFLFNLKRPHFIYKGAVFTEWARGGGISLGLFVFVSNKSNERLVRHEYGHTLQSLILGPLYLIVIGIPSFIWASLPYFRRRRKDKSISYYSLYCEHWADILGKALG